MTPRPPTPPPGSLRAIGDDQTPAGGNHVHPLRRLPSDNGQKTRRALYEAAFDGESTPEGRWQQSRLWMGDMLDVQDATARAVTSTGTASANRHVVLVDKIEKIEKAQEERDVLLIKELGERARTDARHEARLTIRQMLGAAGGLGMIELVQWIVRHL